MAILAIVIIVAAHVSPVTPSRLASSRHTSNGEYEAHAVYYSPRHDGNTQRCALSPAKVLKKASVAHYEELRGFGRTTVRDLAVEAWIACRDKRQPRSGTKRAQAAKLLLCTEAELPSDDDAYLRVAGGWAETGKGPRRR